MDDNDNGKVQLRFGDEERGSGSRKERDSHVIPEAPRTRGAPDAF